MTAALMAGLVLALENSGGGQISADTIYMGIMALVAVGTIAASIYSGKRADIRAERAQRLDEEEAAAERKAAEKATAAEALERTARNDDGFDEFRKGELARLYQRFEDVDRAWDDARRQIGELQGTVAQLQAADRQKQYKIEDQETLLGQLKGLVLRLLDRVDYAWENGHAKPTLTTAERALLDGIPQPAPRNR